jgi:alpha-ketoglutarate-dependent taurine dioxygenase
MKFELKKTRGLDFKSANLIKRDFFSAGQLPLIISPQVPGLDLSQWIYKEKKYVDEELLKYCAVLFRGFDITRIEQFETVVKAYDPTLLSYNERSTPRTAVSNNVYTATEYPADQYIPLHNENSYSHRFSLKLWFCCLVPAATGGETPLADSRLVTANLRKEIVDIFNEKQIMYSRNFTTGIDLDWQTAFQTGSRVEVEEYCRKAGIEFQWKSDGGLQTKQIRPATIRHPITNAPIWFNQAHLFHVSSLDESLRRDLLETTARDALTRNAYFGDGEEIPVSMLDEIRETYRNCQTQFKWEKSDVLLVDNIFTCHARNPFTGPRKVIVAMSEPHQSANDRATA